MRGDARTFHPFHFSFAVNSSFWFWRVPFLTKCSPNRSNNKNVFGARGIIQMNERNLFVSSTACHFIWTILLNHVMYHYLFKWHFRRNLISGAKFVSNKRKRRKKEKKLWKTRRNNSIGISCRISIILNWMPTLTTEEKENKKLRFSGNASGSNKG